MLTARARAEACRRVGQDAHSVAPVAADLGVGWGTVMRAVGEYGRRILDAQWLHTHVAVLGLDATAFLAATPTSGTCCVTGLVDLRPAVGGPTRLFDVVEGRSGAVVADRLAERGDNWYAQVRVAALDPFHGYEVALRCGLPSATVVLDPFHAVRLAQDAINTVRRRVQQDTLGHRGHKGDPLYGIRRVLLRDAANRPSRPTGGCAPDSTPPTRTGPSPPPPSPARSLHHVYAAPNLDRARRRLDRFYRACTLPGAAALGRLGRTISAWEAQLLAYVTTADTSNRPTEAVNLPIKRIKQVGFGFRNFANYRLRLRLHCDVTWPTHHTTRIRGRSPHSTT